jgi:hypothetical protein
MLTNEDFLEGLKKLRSKYFSQLLSNCLEAFEQVNTPKAVHEQDLIKMFDLAKQIGEENHNKLSVVIQNIRNRNWIVEEQMESPIVQESSVVEWEASKQEYQEDIVKTVVIQRNCPTHKSKEFLEDSRPHSN